MPARTPSLFWVKLMRAVLALGTVTVLAAPPVYAEPAAPGAGAVTQQSPQQEQAAPPQAAAEERSPRAAEELRGDLMMVRKRYSEAIEIYEGLLKKEPKNAALMNKIGIAYQQGSHLARARRYYERAIRADRTFAHAYNNLGTVHYSRRSYRSAVNQYRRALQHRDDIPSIYSNLGYAFFMQKKYEEAMQAFGRAIELDPGIFDRRGGSGPGSLLQDRSVTDRNVFYFFLAKTFAAAGNAERVAFYLRKARDEGFQNMAAIEKDPAFAGVLKDPLVQEVLHAAVVPPPTP